MPHQRSTAIRSRLRVGALMLALVPAAATLTSCGFDYPTDRVNTIAGGANNRDHSVDALGIRVLATGKGKGLLIGALSNNLREEASLQSVTSADGRAQAAEFEPIVVGSRGRVNLSTNPTIALTGDFTAGDVIQLELTFSTGETASVETPVVKPCYQYSDVPTEVASPSTADDAAADGADDAADGAEGSAADEVADEVAADEHGDDGDATFNCAGDAPAPEGAH